MRKNNVVATRAKACAGQRATDGAYGRRVARQPRFRLHPDSAYVAARDTFCRYAARHSRRCERDVRATHHRSGNAARHIARISKRRTTNQIHCGCTVGKLLKLGSYGQGVDLVQLALNTHPATILPLLKVDGVFGSKTDARVREFQRNNGLVPYGTVANLTRAALGL